MDEINEGNIQEKINLFQQMQQQAQALTQQTSQIEMSVNEIERTLSEIGNADEKSTMYRAIGSICLLYTSPSPRDATLSRMPSSA